MFQIVLSNSSLLECSHRMFYWTKKIDRDLFCTSPFLRGGWFLCTFVTTNGYNCTLTQLLANISLSSAEMSAHSHIMMIFLSPLHWTIFCAQHVAQSNGGVVQGAGAAGAVRHPRPLDPGGGEQAPLRLLALQEPR